MNMAGLFHGFGDADFMIAVSQSSSNFIKDGLERTVGRSGIVDFSILQRLGSVSANHIP
jgi:hypothetical protein